eukprot:CAMPEP_0116870694 /NCGR_PEP_ID=MMETSP0463-20121206/711_1 /TAXON_ID=181622 /ORGANISM="Strombidinopsis sp, Strain SopsisLIS2011" /LENGTH=39 /DNA_ID= /DNA_START= /DNA_END= /DNA_ORIENTATION=
MLKWETQAANNNVSDQSSSDEESKIYDDVRSVSETGLKI